VRLWDAVTGAALETLEGNSSLVSSVAFSPDGKAEPGLIVSNNWVIEGNENISGFLLNVERLMRLSGIKS
jgi:WD40 repeat protein